MTPSIIQRPPIPGSDGWNWPEGTHRVLRQVFSRRMIGSPGDLDLSLKHLRPVGEFLGLDAGVDALLRHRRGRVVIAGDFDADGATGAALLMLCLRDFGFEFVDVFIPDRFELGYGLTAAAVERIARRRPSLIVTVDNGISSIAGTAAARDRGIDVLITDHHLPGPELPAANAIVNPNLEGNPFGGKHLAGVGVAFYLMAALGRRLGTATGAARYLDLVAIGTMADVVKLDRSNRILVEQGLARIRAGRCRPGVLALCQVAKVPHDSITAGQLAFQIAPRLNAAGRLDDMQVGVRCLAAESGGEARSLADTLNELNLKRREIGAQMDAEALRQLEVGPLVDSGAPPPVVCLLQDDWHEGLVGLVASRIRERFHRPAFAFAPNDSGALKGSGRSVRGFHLRDALVDVDAANPGLISRYGGHAMAAGLTLRSEGFGAFRSAMEALGARRLGPEHFAERIYTDGELRNADLTLEVAELLRDAGPWGQGFPEPLFEGTFRLIGQRAVGDGHLKMKVAPEGGRRALDAIAFRRQPGDWKPDARLRLAYRLDVNDYYDVPSEQLVVEHIQA